MSDERRYWSDDEIVTILKNARIPQKFREPKAGLASFLPEKKAAEVFAWAAARDGDGPYPPDLVLLGARALSEDVAFATARYLLMVRQLPAACFALPVLEAIATGQAGDKLLDRWAASGIVVIPTLFDSRWGDAPPIDPRDAYYVERLLLDAHHEGKRIVASANSGLSGWKRWWPGLLDILVGGTQIAV